ncbi:hydrophobic surface binding protein [Cylindrobasidium torrendii FP15055 ss-10]|uniref:Hydrophobic surface binding protein n=1 Tax=Cylindrobasidium torrendii FP15055 ss-10 TaxID=1314674 RepID=A0A0D7BAP9_9AGAR|nr:hydrophobic surface binding protein [Cylindrobasidium torrendii FP15055 ss-10]
MVSRFALVFCLATLGFASPVKRDVATVEADIANIDTQVTALQASIDAFPATGGTLVNALAIHTSATNLISTIDGATADTKATDAFSEEEGTTILGLVEALEPKIFGSLTSIADKKPAFECAYPALRLVTVLTTREALPIGGVPAIVLQDIKNLDTSTAAFADALIANSPADLATEANAIKDDIAAAFDTAIAVYS